MHIKRLEIQGFKTFAKKTAVDFLSPVGKQHRVTAIVGPNGSGKSNIADAIRWVLGEQSLKLLRGKKSEDVIFSGAEGRGRSGFAEVILTLDNHDKAMPIEASEIAITRRLYRDGESEYLVNDRPSRLADIQLLLAQANVGQKSYSVVGQGMVDHILISSPEERKAFFDDATGVKPFQIKRHDAMLKLKRTYENLAEVEMLLNEITPRLRSLKRQATRYAQREEVERELRTLERSYYGHLWHQLAEEMRVAKARSDAFQKQLDTEKEKRKALETRFAQIASNDAKEDDSGLTEWQVKYQAVQKELNRVRTEHFQTQKDIELAKVRAQSTWAPLPLNKIIEELEAMTADQRALLERVRRVKDIEELKSVQDSIDAILTRSSTLVNRLQRPAPEDIKPDAALVKRLADLATEQTRLEADLASVEKDMSTHAKQEKKVRTDLLDLQRELTQKQKEIHAIEKERNEVTITLARLEERQRNLLREMDSALKAAANDVRSAAAPANVNTEELYPEIQRLRYKIELIGGIDPEIVKEFEETNARHEFLNGQFEDLTHALKQTEKIVDELDEQIRKQSEKAFKDINREFQKFFKVLFGGGSCSLVQMTKDEVAEEAAVTPDRVSEDTAEAERLEHESDTTIEAMKQRVKEREDRVVGIDIAATPPGKKLKALNLLSGGERALTSIALLSAIMAVNPGPFVLLDEVDAALDEANTYRFANILEELSKLTQFIIVTHNRATMEKAHVLYGVTIGNDGVSNLISVNLEDLKDTATARR